MKKTHYTDASMREAYSSWQESGLSKKAYCTQSNIPCSTFHYWIKKFQTEKVSSSPGFIELKIPKSDKKHFLRPSGVEIEYPSGIKIKLVGLPDPGWIKSLL